MFNRAWINDLLIDLEYWDSSEHSSFILIVLCLAAVVGSAVTILLKKANMYTALAIGPLIAPMNDLVSVWIYLTIAFQIGVWL